MTRLRLVLLNAALDGTRDSTTRNFRRELDADLVEYVVSDGQLPPAVGVEDVDGVVVTGSRASAYWDDQWIADAAAWLHDAHAAGLPVLGVCFGHQLLARALGGDVAAMDDFELGYRTVTQTADGPLLAGLEDRFTVFTSHGDTVATLPPGAEVFAENDYGIHAFRLGHAFGVQFHPEYDQEMARAVARGKAFLGDERIERVLDDITDQNYARACEAKRLFENFTDYVRTVRADGTSATVDGRV
ncbi:type 1 glutamine amidotransferase [Halomarina ordinaria]|uniref:Type 1 glutamine amidotransferase n=1 Tax=Halomarina ordinaria TaxID=3033939 RepID=A0ABD5UAH2_9EURY|nr:type 1 glutamine amidotransferase [Halomarina sp. PSRA2]